MTPSKFQTVLPHSSSAKTLVGTNVCVDTGGGALSLFPYFMCIGLGETVPTDFGVQTLVVPRCDRSVQKTFDVGEPSFADADRCVSTLGSKDSASCYHVHHVRFFFVGFCFGTHPSVRTDRFARQTQFHPGCLLLATVVDNAVLGLNPVRCNSDTFLPYMYFLCPLLVILTNEYIFV
jgi:hypothetical protein